MLIARLPHADFLTHSRAQRLHAAMAPDDGNVEASALRPTPRPTPTHPHTRAQRHQHIHTREPNVINTSTHESKRVHAFSVFILELFFPTPFFPGPHHTCASLPAPLNPELLEMKDRNGPKTAFEIAEGKVKMALKYNYPHGADQMICDVLMRASGAANM